MSDRQGRKTYIPLKIGIRCELRPNKFHRLTEKELSFIPLRNHLAPWQRLLEYKPEVPLAVSPTEQH